MTNGNAWHVVERMGKYQVLEGAGTVGGMWAVARLGWIEKTFDNRRDATEYADMESDKTEYDE